MIYVLFYLYLSSVRCLFAFFWASADKLRCAGAAEFARTGASTARASEGTWNRFGKEFAKRMQTPIHNCVYLLDCVAMCTRTQIMANHGKSWQIPS